MIRCKEKCYSPSACRDFGYCRIRNLDAGGMDKVTSSMQEEWRRMDGYGNVWGVFAAGNDLRASFESLEEANGYIQQQPEGFCGFNIRKLGDFP